MQRHHAICFVLTFLLPVIFALDEGGTDRSGKLLSSFQIVRFPNDGCVGGVRNGTCYTSQECSAKGGTSSGSCADGFGVCCSFLINGCGMTSSENITYWTNPTTVMPSCGITVCPTNSDICALRIDFATFVITGPSTLSTIQARRRYGQPATDIADAPMVLEGGSFTTNCLIDVFQTTSTSSATNAGPLCGTLTGQHLYLQADVDKCNLLQFDLGDFASTNTAPQTNDRGVGALAARSWDITVSQIECSSPVLPPPGCTKYFWANSGRAELSTYNFQAAAGTTHLANQHERMCVRRERGNCVGCFAAAVGNFQVSGSGTNAALGTNAVVNYSYPGGCCGYETVANVGAKTGQGPGGGTGSTTMGFDCIIIPGAFVPANGATGNTPIAAPTAAQFKQAISLLASSPVPSPPQICGHGAGIGIGMAALDGPTGDVAQALAAISANIGSATNLTICTRNHPFTLEFLTDDLEGQGVSGEQISANTNNNRGFTLTHTQLGC